MPNQHRRHYQFRQVGPRMARSKSGRHRGRTTQNSYPHSRVPNVHSKYDERFTYYHLPRQAELGNQYVSGQEVVNNGQLTEKTSMHYQE